MKERGKSVLVMMNKEVAAPDILKTLLRGKLERFTNLEYSVVDKNNAIVDCTEDIHAIGVEALLKVDIKDACVSRN